MNPLPIGNRNPVVSPFDNFQCKNDTRLVIACMKQVDFEQLCRLTETTHLLADDKYTNNNRRVQHSAGKIDHTCGMFPSRALLFALLCALLFALLCYYFLCIGA